MRDLSGQQIRGYQVRELIGAGGFAAVYRAYQPTVEREVAIKIILPRYANDPEFVRRFEIEAQLIARLEHMHIVPLYDYWREPNNAYLVMRWLRGGTLYDSLVRDGVWPLEDTARLLEQVAAALTMAHRNGVVHQDLTPANILLDEDRNAFLADFGIAKDLLDFTGSFSGDRPVFGSPAYMAPEQITGTYISAQSDIYSLGIILFHMLTGQLPFDAPDHTTLIRQQVQAPIPPLQSIRSDLSPAFNVIVMKASAKNPGVRYADAMQMAAEFRAAVQTVKGDPQFTTTFTPAELEDSGQFSTLDLSTALAEPQNPYKGLRAFDETDAAHFFGRDASIKRICQRIGDLPDNARLLAVVGPSGSGKSSLVRAGVIPALRRGCVPGSSHWFIARMMPGSYPLAELEMALLGVTFDAPHKLASLLRDKDQGLAAAVAEILPDDGSELLLFIDQFEEVFTLVEWEAERRQFMAALERAVSAPDSRLRVVIALRADFYDRPLQYPAFGELVRANTEVVLPLSADDLRQAIIEPARKELLAIEDAAVDELVREVAEQPGTLPLLQYALTELFERRQDRRLSLDAYRASGGVSGALASRAEDVYAGLLVPQQRAARQLFLRLVTLGDNATDTRRRVLLSELLSLPQIPRDVMQSVLDEFGRYRLLTFDHDPQTREPTVEVAHEALITRWERLGRWLNESRDSLRMQRQLALAADEWRAADCDESFLARGARLVAFEALLADDDVALTDREEAYLEQSIRLRQRAQRLQHGFITVLVVITLAALVAAGFAVDRQRRTERAQATTAAERDRADQQARIARSGELAITALTNSALIDRALLLSLEALRSAETYDARNSLITLLQAEPRLDTMLHDHTAPVRSVAFSADGRWFVTGDRAGNVFLWDARTKALAGQVTVPSGEAVNAVAFAPDSDQMAVGSADGTIYLWQIADLAQAPARLTGHDDAVWGVAFSADGRALASASADTTVRLWDITARRPESVVLGAHDDSVFSVAFSPDGTLVASGGADNAVRLWHVAEGGTSGDVLTGHTNWVYSVAFSPDGRRIASASADNTIRMWFVLSGEAAGDPLVGHTDWVRAVRFGAEGELVSAGADGTIRLWDITSGTNIVLAGHQGAVWGVAWSPDGETIVSAGEDTTVIVWHAAPVGLRLRTMTGHREAVSSVAISPDGTRIASAGGEPLGRGVDNTIRLWDAVTGEQVAVLEGHESVVLSIAFAPDGSALVSSSADGTIRVWSVPDGNALLPPLTDHAALVMAVAISPDGKTLASGASDGGLLLWDMVTGQPAGDVVHGLTAGIQDLAFTPDGTVLAYASEDGTIRLWDMAAGGWRGEPLRGHQDVVTRVTFSPDGTLLASASRDESILLWDWRSAAISARLLEGHTRRITALAFNATGDLLASGSQDATIRLWDVALGRTLGEPITGHSDWVSDLAFVPDGTLVSGSWDTQIIQWAAAVELWQGLACHSANRNLTDEEWSRYLPDVPYSETCPAAAVR